MPGIPGIVYVQSIAIYLVLMNKFHGNLIDEIEE